MPSDIYIELKNICKAFGTVQANHNVNLSVRKGEIHALLGENGSGKSTLVNMLSGIYTPDSGSIFIAGSQVSFSSPKDAIEHGIGMVHQHFKLVEVLTAKENIAAGSKNGFFVKGKKLTEQIMKISQQYGLTVDPDKKIYAMSVGEKQTVEIVKMLYRGADVLILDEPTAVLTPQETGTLFEILRNMKEQGCAIVIITHKLNEVMEISDRVTVLRKGESIATVETQSVTPKQLTEMMVGKPMRLEIENVPAEKSKAPVLEVQGLETKDIDNRNILTDFSFTLYGGEILGVAGIAGSGQKELCEIIAGLCKATAGSVKFMGEELLGLTPKDIIKKGVSMSFVPEDRLGMGLVAGMDIIDNVLLKTYQKTPGFTVNREAGKELAEKIVAQYDISTPSVYQKVKDLSGGNIQKVLLGREVDMNPKLLITAYPVRGLDIGASYHIYHVLNEQKQKGVAILFIGEDLDVLLQLCDRLMVMHAGQIMDIVNPKEYTKEEIGLLMLGHKPSKGGGDNGTDC